MDSDLREIQTGNLPVIMMMLTSKLDLPTELDASQRYVPLLFSTAFVMFNTLLSPTFTATLLSINFPILVHK